MKGLSWLSEGEKKKQHVTELHVHCFLSTAIKISHCGSDLQGLLFLVQVDIPTPIIFTDRFFLSSVLCDFFFFKAFCDGGGFFDFFGGVQGGVNIVICCLLKWKWMAIDTCYQFSISGCVLQFGSMGRKFQYLIINFT